MIYFREVWARDKNIGAVYNHEMNLIPKNEDWCCFKDGDATWTTKFWGNQIEDICTKHHEVGMFTAMTNRVNNRQQLYGRAISDDYNMKNHWVIGELLEHRFGDRVEVMKKNSPVSGVVMIVQKSTWNRVKFREKPKLAGVDNAMHYDLLEAGFTVKLMRGVYIFHKYDSDRSHLR